MKKWLIILTVLFACAQDPPTQPVEDCTCGVVENRWEIPDSTAPHGVIVYTVFKWNCNGGYDTTGWYIDVSDCFFVGDVVCKLLPLDSIGRP